MHLKRKSIISRFQINLLRRKLKKQHSFDRVIKIVKSIKQNDLLEEDDYLYLREYNLEKFLKVGMGSEVVYDTCPI